MNLFINDIPVQILDALHKPDKRDFNTIINAEVEPITKAKLLHRVWVKNAKIDEIEKILDVLDTTSLSGLISLTLTVEHYDIVKTFLKKKFKIIKAAGGLVRKKDKILMIYRLKKWDLPKGKFEKDEKPKQAAQREVEEECNIKVNLREKICTTWHTYTMKKKQILKKTTWYSMDIVRDKDMMPQIEEDIEEVRWMTPKEVFHALEHSYKSISFVFDRYFAQEKEKARIKEEAEKTQSNV
ncbi:NUDIX hydrolase [Fulvivirga lutea]|uniref:NUDIX domain-containing protein n=1 Tax=Fulvivirga lutea TaxID=2810512 RepID=A0A974WIJ1_9BACT|nr:NUDIX domain-containing protein [Fulvivirga lutea]QSE99076.1 NUDIX domain-containing protein [Fulvivirga lutea]